MKSPREKLEEAVQRALTLRAKQALEHVKRIQQPGSPEGDALWKQATVRDRVNLKLVELAASAGRAQPPSQTTNVLGVVVMPARIEDARAWEEQARQVGAPAPRKAIEAEVVPDGGPEK